MQTANHIHKIGDIVMARRTISRPAVRAVVVAVAEGSGTPAISRLRNDGTPREEVLWTGTWAAVYTVTLDPETAN